MAFTAKDLQTDIDALASKLEGNDTKEDELKKALTDVAKGALGIADKALDGGKEKLQKASTQTEDADDEDEADDDEADDDEADDDETDDEDEDEDTQAWLENLMKKRTMKKSMSPRGGKKTPLEKAIEATNPVDVEGYLQAELVLRRSEQKKIARLEKSLKSLNRIVDGILKTSDATNAAQFKIGSTLAKGIMHLIEAYESPAQQNATQSRFALMSKSVRAAGGTSREYDKTLATKMLMDGKINEQQLGVWRSTGVLPPGVSISA